MLKHTFANFLMYPSQNFSIYHMVLKTAWLQNTARIASEYLSHIESIQEEEGKKLLGKDGDYFCSNEGTYYLIM